MKVNAELFAEFRNVLVNVLGGAGEDGGLGRVLVGLE